jgi:hypothetical protein
MSLAAEPSTQSTFQGRHPGIHELEPKLQPTPQCTTHKMDVVRLTSLQALGHMTAYGRGTASINSCECRPDAATVPNRSKIGPRSTRPTLATLRSGPNGFAAALLQLGRRAPSAYTLSVLPPSFAVEVVPPCAPDGGP